MVMTSGLQRYSPTKNRIATRYHMSVDLHVWYIKYFKHNAQQCNHHRCCKRMQDLRIHLKVLVNGTHTLYHCSSRIAPQGNRSRRLITKWNSAKDHNSPTACNRGSLRLLFTEDGVIKKLQKQRGQLQYPLSTKLCP